MPIMPAAAILIGIVVEELIFVRKAWYARFREVYYTEKAEPEGRGYSPGALFRKE